MAKLANLSRSRASRSSNERAATSDKGMSSSFSGIFRKHRVTNLRPFLERLVEYRRGDRVAAVPGRAKSDRSDGPGENAELRTADGFRGPTGGSARGTRSPGSDRATADPREARAELRRPAFADRAGGVDQPRRRAFAPTAPGLRSGRQTLPSGSSTPFVKMTLAQGRRSSVATIATHSRAVS